MWDWIVIYLAQLQGDILRSLAAEMRSGGLGMVSFAFALGALHALTPGHGKAALAAYFLGREARVWKGLRIALSAAFLHVVSGLAVFLVLKFVIGQTVSITGRPSSGFTAFGYALFMLAGLIMLYQGLRPAHAPNHDDEHTLTAGIGLLPCPLTISVLGFAWAQASATMVGLVLLSLALGVGMTFALVALFAIAGRRTLGMALAAYLPRVERWARILQIVAGIVIMALSVYTLVRLRF